jgi:hypothetical protein
MPSMLMESVDGEIFEVPESAHNLVSHNTWWTILVIGLDSSDLAAISLLPKWNVSAFPKTGFFPDPAFLPSFHEICGSGNDGRISWSCLCRSSRNEKEQMHFTPCVPALRYHSTNIVAHFHDSKSFVLFLWTQVLDLKKKKQRCLCLAASDGEEQRQVHDKISEASPATIA